MVKPFGLVPIGFFHRTQSPCFYAFIGLKVLAFMLSQDSKSLLSKFFLSSMSSSLYISKTIKVFCLAETSMSFALYISKTIKVFCLAKTSMSFAFTFQRLSKTFILQRLQCLLSFIFQRLSKFFVLQTVQCLLPFTFQRLSKSFVLQRVQCLLPLHFKDYQSLLSCRDFNVFCLYISKTTKFFCLAETSMSFAFTIQRLSKSFVSQRLQCLLPFSFQRLSSMSFVKTSMSSLHFKDFNVCSHLRF